MWKSFFIAVLVAIFACKEKTDRGEPSCNPHIYVNQGEGTYIIDSVSEAYKKAISEKYSVYPYAKTCGDSAAAFSLFGLINESNLFESNKILAIQLLPKMEEIQVCAPFLFKGSADSLYYLRDTMEDTSLYCTRKYNYLRLENELFYLTWDIAEPKRIGAVRYKLLEIFHQGLKGASGSTLIVRVWYKEL